MTLVTMHALTMPLLAQIELHYNRFPQMHTYMHVVCEHQFVLYMNICLEASHILYKQSIEFNQLFDCC